MTPYIGQVVWCAMMPDVGPMPAIVTAVTGQMVDVMMVRADDVQPVKQITPWLVEDGTEWGWCDIPADGKVPPDFFD